MPSSPRKREVNPKRKPSFHIPFEEFPVPELDDLLHHLEEVKPSSWVIEVSDLNETQHVDCMQPLVHVLVHSTEESPAPVTMGIIYQWCPSCKVAVRVL